MKRYLGCLLIILALGSHAAAQTECTNPDVNCDGVINLDDLLVLLVHFGYVDSNGDGVWEVEVGCMKAIRMTWSPLGTNVGLQKTCVRSTTPMATPPPVD